MTNHTKIKKILFASSMAMGVLFSTDIFAMETHQQTNRLNRPKLQIIYDDPQEKISKKPKRPELFNLASEPSPKRIKLDDGNEEKLEAARNYLISKGIEGGEDCDLEYLASILPLTKADDWEDKLEAQRKMLIDQGIEGGEDCDLFDSFLMPFQDPLTNQGTSSPFIYTFPGFTSQMSPCLVLNPFQPNAFNFQEPLTNQWQCSSISNATPQINPNYAEPPFQLGEPKNQVSLTSTPTSKSGYIEWRELFQLFGIKWDNVDPGDASFTIGKTKAKRFTLKYEDIKNDKNLFNHLKNILFIDGFKKIHYDSRFVCEDEINITLDYVKEKIRESLKLCAKNPNFQSKEEETKVLTLSLISLRIVKEMRDNKTSLPKFRATTDPSELPNEFSKLCNYQGEYSQKKSPDKELKYFGTGRAGKNGIGAACSDYFMNAERMTVQKATKKYSPIEEFNSFNLVRTITYMLKEKIAKSKKEYFLTLSKLSNKICQNAAASQFRPTYVKDLLKFLKDKYQISVTRMLDLSAGWGDRLLAALASSSAGVRQYLATDPNTQLQSKYRDICLSFPPTGFQVISMEMTEKEGLLVQYGKTPDNSQFPAVTAVEQKNDTFLVRIYPHPMEDLILAQFCLNGEQSDAVFTSIPYFNQELYKGINQSHERYKTYAEWKTNFLHKVVDQSVLAVKVGGVIAINSAPITQANKGNSKYDITGDLDSYMRSYDHNNIFLEKLNNFWYDGQPSSNTLIYKVCYRHNYPQQSSFGAFPNFEGISK